MVKSTWTASQGKTMRPSSMRSRMPASSSVYVAVHGLHVAPDAPGRLADRHRPLAGHRPDDLPAPGRKDLPERIEGGERNAGSPGLAAKGGASAAIDLLTGSDGHRHRVRRGPRLSTSVRKPAGRSSGPARRYALWRSPKRLWSPFPASLSRRRTRTPATACASGNLQQWLDPRTGSGTRPIRSRGKLSSEGSYLSSRAGIAFIVKHGGAEQDCLKRLRRGPDNAPRTAAGAGDAAMPAPPLS